MRGGAELNLAALLQPAQSLRRQVQIRCQLLLGDPLGQFGVLALEAVHAARAVEQVCAAVPGVASVDNQLRVMAASRLFTSSKN